MNQAQMHLALTHVPVMLTLFGVVTMIASIITKNKTVSQVSLWTLVAAGVFTIPAFLTGEGAEEVAERIPAILESTIEDHEHFAEVSLWIVISAAILAATSLIKISGKSVSAILVYPVLALALAAAGTMGYTAHLGGQIRHPEIHTGFVTGGAQNSASEDYQEANYKDEH